MRTSYESGRKARRLFRALSLHSLTAVGCLLLLSHPAAAQTVNYRSIGTAGGILYDIGDASVLIGEVVVTFGGGASLPLKTAVGAVGAGDRLVVGTGPNRENLYVLRRDSDTQVTLQSPATKNHTNDVYEFRRVFASISDWEFGRQGNLVADDFVEVGVAYNDGPFAETVTINGSTTDSTHFLKLTVADGQRHNGTAFAGAQLISGNDVKVDDDYTIIEWLVVRDWPSGKRGINPQSDFIVVRNNVLDGGSSGSHGIEVAGNNALVYNNIAYGVVTNGIKNTGSSNVFYNNTLFGQGAGTGFRASSGNPLVKNTIAVGFNTNFFQSGTCSPSCFDAASENNLSSDGTAPGANPQVDTAANLFVSTAADAEDLHLIGGNAIDTAVDLSGIFIIDIDAGVRPAGAQWDIGADELGAAAAVELMSFSATGLDDAVLLEWQTGSELDNMGFHLYRSPSEEGPYEQVTESIIPGLGSSPVGASYSYRDTGLVNGTTYFYKLEDIETTGATELHGPVSATPEVGASTDESGGSEDTEEEARILYGEPSSVSLEVTERGKRQLVLELTTGGFTAVPQSDGSVRLDIAGFTDELEPGSPRVPVKRSWVDAVAGRQVRVASVKADDVVVFSSLRPSVAETSELVAASDGVVRAERRPSKTAFVGDGLYPEDAARVVSVGFQGEEKKALVELAPLRWDAASGELLLARRLTVRLVFAGSERGERSHGGSRGRLKPRKAKHGARDVVARLLARDKGLYAVRFEDVFGSSKRRGVDVSSLSLSRQGEPVGFHVHPDKNRFAPGSSLYFVSEGASLNPFGDAAVYELERGTGGLLMPVDSADPSGASTGFYWQQQEWEENRSYQPGLLEATDLWFWDLLLAPVEKSYPFELSALAGVAEAGRLELRLQGGSDYRSRQDHHVRVRVNGNVVAEEWWEGKTPLVVTAALGPGLLREGDNTLSIENVGDSEAGRSLVLLDRFAVSYPRQLVAESGALEGTWSTSGTASVSGVGSDSYLLDVTKVPARWLESSGGGASFYAEAGRKYLAVSAGALLRPQVVRPLSSGLKDRRNRADYLVIGPSDLLQAAAPLLDLRRSQGLRTKAVPVEDVFAEFGYGEATPEAIREFLTFAYHEWQVPSVRYVLLLGDATYDPKDYLGTGVTNRVPPMMVKTWYLWTASDPAYAAVNGDDILPDVALGRLPAANQNEVRAMVDKILAYERGDATLGGRAVLIADNPDQGGDFEANAAELASGVLASRDVDQIYIRELGAATRGAIVNAFDEGSSVMSYLGHGGIVIWASENVFNMLDVASLSPQTQQPFLITVNCLNGFFHFPYFNSLSEHLLKAEGKGIVGAFSPSGLSLNGPAHRYHRALLSELDSGHHERLGDALLAAQEDYAAGGAFVDLLRFYQLLADPALTLQ